MKRVLILPGFMDSGPLHWQSLWERHQFFLPQGAICERVVHSSYTHPNCETWHHELASTLSTNPTKSILVCHSLGCLNALSCFDHPNVAGALLVAIPNPDRTGFPTDIVGFSSPLKAQIPRFPTVLVASSNDPYTSLEYSAQVFSHLRCDKFINIGERGHINADSGLGEWQAGMDLVKAFLVS